jgi:hypothetical protein
MTSIRVDHEAIDHDREPVEAEDGQRAIDWQGRGREVEMALDPVHPNQHELGNDHG